MARSDFNVVVVVVISSILSVFADGTATAQNSSGRKLSSEDVLRMKLFPVQTPKPIIVVGSNNTAESPKNSLCPHGQCVPYYQCADVVGIDQIDVRFGGDDDDDNDNDDDDKRSPNGTTRKNDDDRIIFRTQSESTTEPETVIVPAMKNPCLNFLHTCCRTLKEPTTYMKLPTTGKIPHTETAPAAPTTSTSTTTHSPPHTVSLGDGEIKGCGYRNPVGIGFRILGDETTDNEAQFGEFPWTVAILADERMPTQSDDGVAASSVRQIYRCGGTLIHPSVVLTAAHCVYTRPVGQLTVRAGEWDSQSGDEIYGHQDRRVVEREIHADYNKGSLASDVALLFVDWQFPHDQPNIRPACLPQQDHSFEGQSGCFASGWGKNGFGSAGHLQAVMKRVELPIVPFERCQRMLRQTRLGQHFRLHRSFVCAGGRLGADTCDGDGGSPLVCPLTVAATTTKSGVAVDGVESVRYYQAGIVSWGIGCGEERPAVYVNVAAFRNWIDAKLAARGLSVAMLAPDA